jgi:hypothetical protein
LIASAKPVAMMGKICASSSTDAKAGLGVFEAMRSGPCCGMFQLGSISALELKA